MKLEDIGFYTLSDERAFLSCLTSPMWRCEILLTDTCNFKCPYCRGFSAQMKKGHAKYKDVIATLSYWTRDNLQNIRFSGGEPTMYPLLEEAIIFCKDHGVKRIAVSTNGSRRYRLYEDLVRLGVNDFSISLDACCASFGDIMSGNSGKWTTVVDNIKRLSEITYVTVGVVVTEETAHTVRDVITYAHSLGVADIRIISAAQYNEFLKGLEQLNDEILDAHPILRYRVTRYLSGQNVRGIKETDSHKCGLTIDDSIVVGDKHYPCVIYAREGGDPIGSVGPEMRRERYVWAMTHNTFEDDVCRKNCLDICIAYNNKWAEHH